jgi:hypothetical protein
MDGDNCGTMEIIVGGLPTATLDKPSPHFSEGEILYKGGIPGDPMGK